MVSEEQRKEKARIRSARYYTAHPERAQQASKRWRDKNRKRINSKSSEYAKSRRHQYRLYCIARRTKKTQAGGSFTVEEGLNLCFEYDNRCLCCCKLRPLTADHVLPVSKGGSSYIENIQPLCGPCNYSKGAKHIDYRGRSK